VSLPKAYDLLANTADLNYYRDLYKYMSYFITKGFSLETIISSYPHVSRALPLYCRQLLVNGERSGRLPENLLKLGEIYLKRNEITVKDLGTIFEPILLIVVWIGVALFAVAVILPIYSLSGNLQEAATGKTNPEVIQVTVTPVIVNK